MSMRTLQCSLFGMCMHAFYIKLYFLKVSFCLVENVETDAQRGSKTKSKEKVERQTDSEKRPAHVRLTYIGKTLGKKD